MDSMRGIHTKRNQAGLAAIIVATIIMVILSLITLGFARIMRREQRQSLDRSLSSQAFYAAESAVNDAVKRVQDEISPYTADKTTCTGAPFNGAVDNTLGSSYTCLLIDQAPPTLEYTQGSITTNSSKVIPIREENGVTIPQLRIAWEDPGLNTTAAGLNTTPVFTCPVGSPQLPAFTSWNSRIPGMLRLDIIPSDALDRASLATKTVSMYLYPASAGCNGAAKTIVNYSSQVGDTNKGQIIKVNCTAGNGPRDCELKFVFDGASPNRLYYMRVRSIYHSSDMTIRAFSDTNTADNASSQVSIKGAQVQIDATGKVNDVLRRIQVRVPVIKSYPIPEFVLQTTDSICKKIEVAPPSIADTSKCPF